MTPAAFENHKLHFRPRCMRINNPSFPFLFFSTFLIPLSNKDGNILGYPLGLLVSLYFLSFDHQVYFQTLQVMPFIKREKEQMCSFIFTIPKTSLKDVMWWFLVC